MLKLEDEIGKRLIGQTEAVVAVSDAVRRSRSGLSDPNKPIGSFIFLGQTGVGKTQLAKVLANELFDSEDALIRIGIPYRVYGGQRFYERLEIRNALAYLRLCVSRGDDAAFERVINTPTRGIGARTLENIRDCARETNQSLWAASCDLIANNARASRASNAIAGFIELINALEQNLSSLPLNEQVSQMLDMTGLIDFHRAEKGERGQTRVENLHELISACKSYSAEDTDAPALPQFLADAALDAGDTQADEHQDAVQLMTLHSAKGLEFPLVILAGMEENLFPHSMSAEEPGRLEEERRLCYVGMTRAMEKLVLTYAECRRWHGDDRYNTASRYVRDLPPELVQEVRVNTASTAPRSTASSLLSPEERSADTGFNLGDRVTHPKFGDGMVLNIEGHGAQARIQVNFESAGSKWLIVAYAKLSPAL